MADASCSGGTPFKQLIDQQGRDVSQHQDRLVGRPGAQGPGTFRSAPQPGFAQNGFDQFMNGPANHPGIQNNHAAGRVAAHAAALGNTIAPGFGPQFHQGPQALVQPQVGPAVSPQGPAASANWAAEFNRFAHPNQTAQQASIQPGPRQMMPPQVNHQGIPEISDQVAMANQIAHMEHQMTSGLAYRSNPNLPNGGFSPLYGPTNSGHLEPHTAFASRGASEAEFTRHMDDWMAVNGPQADARIDAILEEMAQELEASEAAAAAAAAAQDQTTAAETDLNTAQVDQETTPVATGKTAMEIPNIASLSLDTPETKVTDKSEEQGEITDTTPTSQGKQRSEIAEAAGDLLKSVQHEQGEKWKKSKFIELMTEFAEGRKDVVDNEIRVVDGNGNDLSSKQGGTSEDLSTSH